MSQIDTTPPASFHPQPESSPTFDWDDESIATPVPNLYLQGQHYATQARPSERITTATYELGIVTPVQIVNKSENGIGSRVALTLAPTGCNIAIASSMEALLSITTPGAPLTSYIKAGFVIPASTGAFTISTCEEIWAIGLTTGAIVAGWVSVLQEQFYGD